MTISRVGDERWKNLATLPSTNFKMVSGSLLTWLTAFVYLWLVLRGNDAKINETTWSSWLIFLGAALGLNVGQYIGKRMTYAAPSPDSERAGVPTDPPPAKPAEAPVAPAAGAVAAVPTPALPVSPRNPVVFANGNDEGIL